MDEDTQVEAARGRRRGPQAAPEPPPVAGYDIVQVLGRGGMGVVWEAIEHRLERRVALKVHSGASTPARVAQLWAEAQLAAKIAHPGVVPVYEVGETLDGRPYYTMELVEGTDLRAVLRDGALSLARALAFGAEIADAVAAAHERGIVHCDLKPANVLVDARGSVRILDFGLAERVGAPREQTLVRGSPPYMSPEQIMAQAPTEASDVYSMGVILYEMLTGALPFSAPSVEELLLTVTTDPPAPLSHHRSGIQADVERACLRCLEKEPSRRFPSARALREALIALAEGRPLSSALASPEPYTPRPITVAPRARAVSREQATRHHRWAWTFEAPPERVWPFVANTDRFNKAVGLPAVEFEDRQSDGGGWARTGRFRAFGMSIFWDEHPFEWVRDREHSVFREYRLGPLKALWNRVSLTPVEGGRTELVHEMWVIPSGVLGRVAALVELQLKTARRMDQFYRRLGAALASPSPPEDFFEPPYRPTAAQRAAVEKGAAHLARDGRFPERLVSELAGLLLHTPSKRLERIKPYALAASWRARREEVLDLFLHAASAGLVDVAWDLICPSCQTAHESARSLQHVAKAGACTSCGTSYERDLSRSVELVFRPHRAIREVRAATYCMGAPALRPHVLAQQILQPGERRSFTVELPRGEYQILATRGGRAWDLSASAAGATSSCTLRFFDDAVEARPHVVQVGPVEIDLLNGADREEVFRLEVVGRLADDVMATIAMSHPSFKEFFSDEVLARGEHLSVGRMAFLLADVEDRQALFEQRGDAGAFGILTALEEQVRDAAQAHQGSLVEVDAASGVLVAAFATGALAARAAVAASAGVAAAVAASEDRAAVRMVVHEGRCLALTRGRRIQYFGETLQRGVSLLAACDPGAVAVSAAVADDPDAARAIHEMDVEREVSTVRSGRYRGRRVTLLRPRP